MAGRSMIDPFVSLFMPSEDRDHTHNEATNRITVEEAIDCRNSNARLFSLLDKHSQLSIIINDNSTITSCNLAGHEIVVDRNLYHELHETWAVGDRPFQKLSSLPWTSHVRGSELILSSSTGNMSNNNPHTTLHFELTPFNELHCVAKLKTIHLQHQVFYYNLNRAQGERRPVAGHTLVVSCNGGLNRIRAQPTKLLCHCNKSSPVLPQSLVGNIPFELGQHPEDPHSDDLVLCDAIYCLESSVGSQDYLQAQLQYRNRVLTFEVRSTLKSASTQAQNANNVSSSSSSSLSSTTTTTAAAAASAAAAAAAHPSENDLKLFQGFARPPKMEPTGGGPSWGASSDSEASSSSGPPVRLAVRVKLEPLDSTSSCNRSAPSSSDVSTSHASTMLRLRVRVTNFGVSILPIMMTNYAASLAFSVV